MTYKDINLEKLIIYDIETTISCFIMNCLEVKTGAKKSFIIYDDKKYEEEPLKLFKFLRNCVRNKYSFIGFNNVAFDAQVIDYFYEWCCTTTDPLFACDLKFIIDSLYKKAQDIINLPDEEKFKQLTSESQLFAPQIDLYKQKHYDRPLKATSLKWIQFTTRYPNIEEMPIGHDEPITIDQVDDVSSYCWNDVDSTFNFFKKIKFETELRLKLSEEYKRNLVNASEPRMAREIFGTILAPQMGIEYSELRKMRTIRKIVNFKDIIFPYVKFVTPELQKVLDYFKTVSIDCNPHSKQTFEYNFNYHGLDVYLGLGGIHSCITPGVYTPAADEICKDSDAKSFYPNLAIQNGLKPMHLGDAFTKVYSDIYEQRKVIPKSDPKNYIYKILLNSAYGLSSEINSYFYDKQFTYGITVNGQLSLLMLCEALYTSVPGVRFLQKNTDGITYIYNNKYDNIVQRIWKWWETTTKIELEHAEYSKMIIQDVNNYIAVDLKGKAKKKGAFETELDYNKNPSHLIIPKAIENYFVNGVPIENTIRESTNIYDFCGGIKRKSNFKLNLYRYVGSAEIIEEQQKVTRYFVSNNKAESGQLMKDFDDGRKVSALAGIQVQILNKVPEGYEDAHHYNINYDYYIANARKIIQNITPAATQTTLF